MVQGILRDVMLLASSKKTLARKASYLLKGVLFAPLLISDIKKLKGKENISTMMSASGDDIYPLF